MTLFPHWSQSQRGSMESNGLCFAAALTSEDTDPHCFHRCWYVRTVVSFILLCQVQHYFGLTEITRKEFSTFFGFEIPIHKITQLGLFFFSSSLKSNLIFCHHLATPSSLTLHSGPWTLPCPCAAVILCFQDIQQTIPLRKWWDIWDSWLRTLMFLVFLLPRAIVELH